MERVVAERIVKRWLVAHIDQLLMTDYDCDLTNYCIEEWRC